MEYDRTYSIRKGEYFADALKRTGKDFIPTNCIINKLLPGLGATHCELTAPRKSIIIEPNVPVIESKAKKHKNALAFYKGVTIRKVADFLEENRDKHYKLLTTPEGFTKIKEAMQAVGIDMYAECFILFDECEKLVQDVHYRDSIREPMKGNRRKKSMMIIELEYLEYKQKCHREFSKFSKCLTDVTCTKLICLPVFLRHGHKVQPFPLKSEGGVFKKNHLISQITP